MISRDNRSASSTRMTISFLGVFGGGNLGNEGTLSAILQDLRERLPDVDARCICPNPEAASAIHQIAACPMHEPLLAPALRSHTRLARFLRKCVLGIPLELYRWVKAYNRLAGTRVLIVPGTQFLSDNLTGSFGWPYQAFKWAVAARLRGCKLLFVSVGVGPLRHGLSRRFVKCALALAHFRSYRDDASKLYVRDIGFDSMSDPIYPDLAFSLRASTLPAGRRADSGASVVAVGVKDYRGQYGSRPRPREADSLYRRYVDTVAEFVAWLLDHGYTVRLVIGDTVYDPPVVADVRLALAGKCVDPEHPRLLAEPIETLEALISQLAASDVVVSPRFHNVLFGLMLDRAVLAVSYHEKFSALMPRPELARYSLQIDGLETSSIIARFEELQGRRDELRRVIGRHVGESRVALDEQYRLIIDTLSPMHVRRRTASVIEPTAVSS